MLGEVSLEILSFASSCLNHPFVQMHPRDPPGICRYIHGKYVQTSISHSFEVAMAQINF